MNYLLYPFLIPCDLFLSLLCKILSPILPLFAKNTYGWCDNQSYEWVEPRLPGWLSLFQTPDNSLYGDATFQAVNGRSYWSMAKWLRRNPAYGFSLKYINTIENKPILTGDDTIKDNDNAKAGWCFVRCAGLFQLTWVRPIGFGRCIYCVFGWNIRGTLHQAPTARYQATFACSPRLSGFRP